MYCPNCNKEHDGKFCPECGTKLIEKPSAGGFNLNFGDANAISGGVNLSDSHNVQNVDNSVHNTTNTSNVVNNIVERQKTASEELQEKKMQFNQLLDEVFADNVLTEEENLMVKNYQHQLGLDDATAQVLIDNARRRAHTNTRQESLGAAAGPVKQLTMLFQTNQTDRIKTMIPRMAAFARNFKVDEVQHKYYVALAAMNPEELIRLYETDLSDNYWRSYWAYIAYRKLGQNDKAEDILWGVLPNFSTYSVENTCLLQCVGEIADFGIETAAETLKTITGNYSPELALFANALYRRLDPEKAADFGANEENTAFYCHNILLEEEMLPCNEEAVDAILEQHKGKYKLFDFSGKLLSKTEYDNAYSFSEGLAWVRKDGKYGYIDNTGREVVPCKYDDASSFSEGLARVKKDGKGKYGYIDKAGREVVPYKYDVAYSFREGLGRVMKNGKYGYIDKAGREVVPYKYDYASSFSEGLAIVMKDGKYGYIDNTGREVVPYKYDCASSFSEGLAGVMKDGKCGYIDNTGREVVPYKYDHASSFSEGLAGVEKNGKWGYIDNTGREVVPCKYDYAYSFSEGLAWVKKDGKCGFIDNTGREVVPCKYDDADSFSKGLAWVKKDGKYGFIDKTGREVVPCKYDDTDTFKDGVTRVTDESKGKDMIIDSLGREILSFKSVYKCKHLGQGVIALMQSDDNDDCRL